MAGSSKCTCSAICRFTEPKSNAVRYIISEAAARRHVHLLLHSHCHLPTKLTENAAKHTKRCFSSGLWTRWC